MVHADGSTAPFYSSLRKWLMDEHPGAKLRENLKLLFESIPELKDADGLKQNPESHKYDVLDHSIAAVEAAPRSEVVRVAALLHDVGKTVTKVRGPDGVNKFPDHGHAGAPVAREILKRIGAPANIVDEVPPLVHEHFITYSPRWSDKKVRTLAEAVSLRKLELLANADLDAHRQSCPYLDTDRAQVEALMYRAREVAPAAVKTGSRSPWAVMGFSMAMADSADKLAFDIPRELLGALAGGALGGLGGYAATSTPEHRKRNAALGAVGGAALGAGAAHFLGGDGESPPQKLENVPGSSPARPQIPEPAKLQAQQVEPMLQQSEAATRQNLQGQLTSQAIQLSSARERAALLRDQGQVATRAQALMAPRAQVAPAAGAPRVITPEGRIESLRRQLAGQRPHLVPTARMGTKAASMALGVEIPAVDWAVLLPMLGARPKLRALMGAHHVV